VAEDPLLTAPVPHHGIIMVMTVYPRHRPLRLLVTWVPIPIHTLTLMRPTIRQDNDMLLARRPILDLHLASLLLGYDPIHPLVLRSRGRIPPTAQIITCRPLLTALARRQPMPPQQIPMQTLQTRRQAHLR
jgi:hypothetical protein